MNSEIKWILVGICFRVFIVYVFGILDKKMVSNGNIKGGDNFYFFIMDIIDFKIVCVDLEMEENELNELNKQVCGKWFILFERVLGSWWNFKFDLFILE